MVKHKKTENKVFRLFLVKSNWKQYYFCFAVLLEHIYIGLYRIYRIKHHALSSLCAYV